MQRFSIARSLRLALIALTLILAVVAALGIASLYNARQRYEDKLAQSAAVSTAAANLLAAGIAEEEVLRDATGPGAGAARQQVARTYTAAAASALSLARDDAVSSRLLRTQIAAESLARSQAAGDRLALASAAGGPFASARSLAGAVQARQRKRQAQARASARSDSRRAVLLVAIAGALAVIGALALITLLVGSMRRPLDALVAAGSSSAGSSRPGRENSRTWAMRSTPWETTWPARSGASRSSAGAWPSRSRASEMPSSSPSRARARSPPSTPAPTSSSRR
jgi:hypothetical protein